MFLDPEGQNRQDGCMTLVARADSPRGDPLPPHAASAADWLLAARTPRPDPRRGVVPRPDVVSRLVAARAVAVVLVSAPPGYGKTTLLTDWDDSDERPFA